MSTLDKASVRKEIDRLKDDFEQLRVQGKVTAESQAVMSSLFMIVELILAIFLEQTTKKTSRNSSLPPSQTSKDETSVTDLGSQRKGKTLNRQSVANLRTVETVKQSAVNVCDICGESLTDVSCTHHERRTKIDIVFEKVVEHVGAEVKQCPQCKTQVKGQCPKDMPGPVQYGHGVKAFVIHLLVSQMVALNRAQQLLTAMMDVVIAEATLLKLSCVCTRLWPTGNNKPSNNC